LVNDDAGCSSHDRRANGVDHFGGAVTLVEVDPARDHRNRLVANTHGEDAPVMTGHRRQQEARQIGRRHLAERGAHRFGRFAPARTEYHGAVEVVHATERPQGVGGATR
jgi:hypothetical protein